MKNKRSKKETIALLLKLLEEMEKLEALMNKREAKMEELVKDI